MIENKVILKNQDTYIYIDVSNIRLACKKTLGWQIDFVKLLEYFRRKYPNLQEVRYYEGIAKGDVAKWRKFNFLNRKGYTVCPLERKAYTAAEMEEKNMQCPKCGHEWMANFIIEHKTLKSNVDVYLASDMAIRAARADCPTRIILVSCDGDYTEAIKNMLELNENVSVTVLATLYARDRLKNTCSSRLKALSREIEKPRFMLNDIKNVKLAIELAR